MVATGAREATSLWSTTRSTEGAEVIGELPLIVGDRYLLHTIETGPEDSVGTSAEAYSLWYQIKVPDVAEPVWVEALYPSTDALGSDGRSSSVRFDFFPATDGA
jgi:hypothetical protein